jgi:frataxin
MRHLPRSLLHRRLAAPRLYAASTPVRLTRPLLLPPHPARAITRPFHPTFLRQKGLSPESSEPPPPTNAPGAHVAAPAHITPGEYHAIADAYIEKLVAKLEELAEAAIKDKLEVEYSV